MKTLFIDSDILIDAILVRLPHYEQSSKLLDLSANTDYTFCTAVHTLLNVHYIIKKRIGLERANAIIKNLTNRLHIITESADIVKQAVDSDFSDFEDAVQHFAAVAAKADYIITRNIKDYKHATIPVLTAELFLRTIL